MPSEKRLFAELDDEAFKFGVITIDDDALLLLVLLICVTGVDDRIIDVDGVDVDDPTDTIGKFVAAADNFACFAGVGDIFGDVVVVVVCVVFKRRFTA